MINHDFYMHASLVLNFLKKICACIAMNFPLSTAFIVSNFLEELSSLSHSIVMLYVLVNCSE